MAEQFPSGRARSEAFRARVRDLLLPVSTSSAVAGGGQGAAAASSGESAKAAFMADAKKA